MTPEPDSDNADLFDGRANGSLHFTLAPVADPRSRDTVDLGLDLHEEEWSTLFFDVLGVRHADWVVLPRNARRILFRQALPDYPMLAEVWDIYEDATYLPEEIPRLRDECLQVKSRTTNAYAVKALRKLIYASEEAAKRDSCLLLLGD